MGLLTTFTLDQGVTLTLLDLALPLDIGLELRISELRLEESGEVTGNGMFVSLPTQWNVEINETTGRRRRIPVDHAEMPCSFRCYLNQDADWIVAVTLQD